MRVITSSILVSLALLSGCSQQFKHYNLDATKESAASSFQSATILDGNKVDMVISAVYLNDVYPQYPLDASYFLVAVYSKNPAELLFLTGFPYDRDNAYVLKRGSDSALSADQLDDDDPLIELMPIHTRWAKYYYVTYPYRPGTPTLILTSKDGRTAKMTFRMPTGTVMFTQKGSVGKK